MGWLKLEYAINAKVYAFMLHYVCICLQSYYYPTHMRLLSLWTQKSPNLEI